MNIFANFLMLIAKISALALSIILDLLMISLIYSRDERPNSFLTEQAVGIGALFFIGLLLHKALT